MVNLRLLGERNFLACGLIIYISFAVLYGANVDTPQMLQELFGYDAFRAGLVLSPAAFFTMAMMPIVGFLLGRKVDARYIIPFGLICLAGACVLAGAPGPVHLALSCSSLPRCVQMAGVGMLFVPLNNAAYLYLPRNQVNNATGLFNMLRNEGGSLGIAIVTVLSRPPQPVPPVCGWPSTSRRSTRPSTAGRTTSRRPGWSAAGSRGSSPSSRAWACCRRWSTNRPG